jgi:hypothetical protein
VDGGFIDGKLLTIQMLVSGDFLRGGCFQILGPKKCRGWQWRTSRPFQPRLPGSVVGEASMDWDRRGDKITKAIVL